MATLKQGSKGSEVKELQTLLNNNGAKLSVDGVFGPKTFAAVKSYQKANGLSVDGIVGNNTWGSLRGTTSSTPAATETTPTATGVTQETGPTATAQTSSTSSSASISGVPADTMAQLQNMEYTPSQNVLDAYNKLQEQAGTKPSPYVSQWSDQLEELYNQIVSRGKEGFDYDLNGDSLWQQYKDQYVNLGRRAMEDTMGNAASLTGGYGNSYASTAGNQAYQQYLTQLTNMIPELEGRAYERWRDQGEDLYNQYGLVADRENQDYGRYRDDVSDYYIDRNYNTDYYKMMYDQNYGEFRDNISNLWNLASALNQDYWTNENYELAKEQIAQATSSSGGGGGGGDRTPRNPSDPTPKLTDLTKKDYSDALDAFMTSYSEGEALGRMRDIVYQTGMSEDERNRRAGLLLDYCKKNATNNYINPKKTTKDTSKSNNTNSGLGGSLANSLNITANLPGLPYKK